MRKNILMISENAKRINLLQSDKNRTVFVISHSHTSRPMVKSFLAQNCCLIILDMPMTEEQGFHVLLEIRKLYDIPILIISSEKNMSDMVCAIRMGADDYLVLPFEDSELIMRVHSLICRYTVFSNPVGPADLSSDSDLQIDTLKRSVIDGKNIASLTDDMLADFRRENLGFVFQNFNLLDTLTLYENIALPLTINKIPVGQISSIVTQISTKLGIQDALEKYPYQVSGWQKQRSACARAVVNHPKLVLADEPTGALDSSSAQILLETFCTMNEQLGATILMVTHDSFAASYTKRILCIKGGTLFGQLTRDEKPRKEFHTEILHFQSLMYGGQADVL